MSRDHHDALMEQLLREILGGDRPRDMTARVLAQARIYDRFRRRLWISAGAAIAASVVLIASLFVMWPQNYPGPVASNVTLVNGDELQPGVIVQTVDESGSINLGNYVDVIMRPQTALTLGGGKYREKVFLEQGELQVSVRKNKGRFEVAVGPATVQVTGTRFNVNVVNEDGDKGQQKKLLVSVDDGSVEIQGIPGQTGAEHLAAGDKKEYVIAYTPRFVPPVNTALRTGLLAAAQESARTGNRGGNRAGSAARPLLEQLLVRVPLPQALANQNRPANFLPLIVHTGTGAVAGKLRRDHDLFYLETAQGANIYMFSQASVPNSTWALPMGQAVKVFWEEGRVTDVIP